MRFQLHSQFKPAGDQPQAIAKLTRGLAKWPAQTLLGVTGSGKTFTAASIIHNTQLPALILSPNKTLAAQLYNEFQNFFPANKVCYFVSYYDYYQPESYLPPTDTYIEKDAKINERIERLRIETAANVLTRADVIVVASVSCIYGFGRPAMFEKFSFKLEAGQEIARDKLLADLIKLQFKRNDLELKNGRFRVKGDIIDIVQGTSPNIIRIQLFGDQIEKIQEIDYFNGSLIQSWPQITIVPANPYLFEENNKEQAMAGIRRELEQVLPNLGALEAHRLKQRTEYDLEMINELGYCNGIENYSRYFDQREPGRPPYTLLDFFDYNFGSDWLMFIDESHAAIPQLHGMQRGDQARKKNLVENGFRLPSAYDNRPLKFEEFEKFMHRVIFTSATPGDYEFETSGQVVEQIIRPTGLVDPPVQVKPVQGQIQDLMAECKKVISRKYRVLITTLTKRMAENLAGYLKDHGLKVEYLHSEIDTLERTKIIANLRRGKFDILVGINLLREGLDLPEVALVAILDADKEGFLRNARSLIQTMGRAARNADAKVILYGDQITASMKQAMAETNRRRAKQLAYNKKHKIQPKSIIKEINSQIAFQAKQELDLPKLSAVEIRRRVQELEEQMHLAAEQLDFERAIELRDQLQGIQPPPDV